MNRVTAKEDPYAFNAHCIHGMVQSIISSYRSNQTITLVTTMSERGGPFEKKVSDEDILAFIEQEEVVTTKEVAEHFSYHLQTARRRLKQLHQAGKLRQKDVSKRFVWWIER